jgi:hypothetical protein
MTYMTETDTFEEDVTRWAEDDDPESLMGQDAQDADA